MMARVLLKIFMSYVYITYSIKAFNITSSHPHIVFILADDLGWNDVSFHGSKQIPTPNIDKLVHDGIFLNNYYVSPICTPTRGALLTGRHPMSLGLQRSVIVGDHPWGLGLNETILPQYLKKQGYSTHAVGKWHLGFFAKELTPLYRGFDSFYGYYLGAQDYIDHVAWARAGYEGYDFRDGVDLDWPANQTYSTELFTTRAEKIINAHNTSKPIFLYMPHQAVHSGIPVGPTPLEAPKKYTDKFPYITDPNRRIFAGMVSALDDSVGNITKALAARGMLDNCVIIFSTDNGGPAAGYDMNYANNWPLRGMKHTLWEGGIRASGFIWSRLLNKRSRVSNQLIHVTDWLPTIMHVAGAPEGYNTTELYGMNMWETLSNDLPSPRNELVHNYDETTGAIRVDDYKLIVIGKEQSNTKTYDDWYQPESVNVSTLNLTVKCSPPTPGLPLCNETTSPCLYNIIKDPCEFDNIALQYPGIIATLQKKMLSFASKSQAPRICPSDEASNPVYHGNAWVPWIKLDSTKKDDRQCPPQLSNTLK